MLCLKPLRFDTSTGLILSRGISFVAYSSADLDTWGSGWRVVRTVYFELRTKRPSHFDLAALAKDGERSDGDKGEDGNYDNNRVHISVLSLR